MAADAAAARPATVPSPLRDRRLRARDRDRVVRLLPLRRPRRVLRDAVLPAGNEAAALLASLATFGAGFAVRPFGAAFFGRIGDIIGRKFTFLVTIT